MHFYEVLVTQKYAARNSLFTYASKEDLQRFQLVLVPLQKKSVMGVVVKKVAKPAFETKLILESLPYLLTEQQQKLIHFIQQFYMATEAQALELFLPHFLKPTTPAPPTAKHTPIALPPLTHEQKLAIATLAKHSVGTAVIHGNTGTGKTRLFIERLSAALANNKTALVLVPEIALVPHMYKQLHEQFGDVVASYHSMLTEKQRSTVWQAVYQRQVSVIVGTRSSLFLPMQDIGLIVIDESHEPAYKQEDGVRYHASRLAGFIAHTKKAQLLLASGTPLVTDIYRAALKKQPIVRLTAPAIASEHTVTTHIIDMKNRDLFSKQQLLSKALLAQIETAIQNGEQSLVYLNRRGTARAIICAGCGWQAACGNCHIALTYHHDNHTLKCHTCNQKKHVPYACPDCGSPDILFKSAGTKALAAWLQKRFPLAKIARFDTDNNKAESLAERFSEVKNGSIDILVGTQMLVKGLDLPKLAVVGIVAADLSLQVPDYTAEERTYQLVNQAIGRVGRGHRSGHVFLQTFTPNSKLIQQALTKKYDDFYTTQIQQRKNYTYPPFCDVAVLWCFKKSTANALQEANKVLTHIRKKYPIVTFLGPVVALHTKKKGFVTSQIVVKTTQRSLLNEVVKQLPNGWQYDLEPAQIL